MRVICALLCLSSLALPHAQDDGSGMQQYWFGLIKRPSSAPTLSAEQAMELQRGHMANIGRLVADGSMVLAGPFGHDGELRGLFIYDVETREQAEALVAGDPAVAAGRLEVELYPWWGPTALTRLSTLTAPATPATPATPWQSAGRSAEAVAADYLAAYLAGDLAALSALLADDALFLDPTSRLQGRDAIVQGLAAVFADLTIDSFDQQAQFQSGTDRFVAMGRVRFQHSGDGVGRPAQRLSFDTPFVVTLQVADCAIVRHEDLVDSAEYQRQLLAQLASGD